MDEENEQDWYEQERLARRWEMQQFLAGLSDQERQELIRQAFDEWLEKNPNQRSG